MDSGLGCDLYNGFKELEASGMNDAGKWWLPSTSADLLTGDVRTVRTLVDRV